MVRGLEEQAEGFLPTTLPGCVAKHLLVRASLPWEPSSGRQKVRHSVQTNILFIELHMNFH